MAKQHTKYIDIADIVPYEQNSKKHPPEQINLLKNLITEFGFTRPLLCVGNQLKAGHGALLAVKSLINQGEKIYPPPGKSHDAIPFPAGKLPCVDATGWSEAQARAYVIADNKSAELADWDNGILITELEALTDGGFDIGLTGFDVAELDGILGGGGDDSPYTDKIISPIYKPKEAEPPPIKEIFDTEKYDKIIESIKAADVPKEIKDFLFISASRHIVFDFHQIAEFYSHADKSIKKEMERQALVIIDFDSAIENGYVKLTEDLQGIYDSENTE